MRINSPKLNIMHKACMKASRSLIRDFGEIEKLQVSKKGPSDFVTNSDLKTEKILIQELKKAKPNYSILSEENGIEINKDNATANLFLLVDDFLEKKKSILFLQIPKTVY